MKTSSQYLFFLIIFAVVYSGSTFAQKKATVSGNIRNASGEMIYLKSYVVKSGRIHSTIVHDSCLIEKGNFKLSAKLDSLTELYFSLPNKYGKLFIKPGEDIFLTLNTDFFDETIEFEGDGEDRNNLMAQVNVIMQSMTQSRNILFGKFELDPEIDTIPFYNGLAKIDSAFYDFVDFELASYPELKESLEYVKYRNKMITKTYINRMHQRIAFSEMQKKEAGSPFLDAVGIDLEGKEVKISDFYGKLTVLDFWATWCKPCIAEFPALHNLEKKFEGKVTFIGIASKCKKEDWEKMAKKEGFQNSIYVTKENTKLLSEKYAIHSIPRYIILDAAGNVLDPNSTLPSSGLEDKLNELLK
jgi:thiol-disulfide isomerase/thioredoxin